MLIKSMTKKINIAFLLVRVKKEGGISRVTGILANELYSNQNYNIHIISFQKKELPTHSWNKNLTYHDLCSHDNTSMKKGIFKAIPKLRNILQKSKIDVLVGCGEGVGVLGSISSLLYKTKFIYWSHSSFKGKTHNKYKLFNEYFATSFAKVVVSLTKADKVNYSTKTLARRVEQIYNPVDEQILSKNRIYNPNSKIIISVGRLGYQKNFLLLVDVAKKVLNIRPEFSWHIYGSGEQELKIKEKIRLNGLEENLILKGHTNNIYDLYNDYSMMVMTSRFEGFPMGLVEGLACKLPLVSFDILTGPNEIIKDGINGYLVEANNIDSMSEKIIELIDNKTDRILFSNATEEIVKTFEIKQITQKWIDLINSIL